MKFVIAGLGSIGRRHLRNLIALGETDILLYRTKKATLPDEDLASFPVETDLEKALATNPKAVIVSNPTALHLDVAIPAAKAGCFLFLEKPLSINSDGLQELGEVLSQNGKAVFIGFQFRFHPALQQISKWIGQGSIGRVLSSSVFWGEYLPDWHPWEDYRKAYSARKDLGGGVVRTLCHPIDYMRWLIGEVGSVSACVGQVSDLELEVEDHAEIVLEHRNHAITRIHLDYYRRPKRHDLEIIGSQGVITWDEASACAKLYQMETQEWQEFHPDAAFERNAMFQAEMDHFLNLVEGKEAPVCSFSDGMRVQQIIDAVYESSSAQCKRINL